MIKTEVCEGTLRCEYILPRPIDFPNDDSFSYGIPLGRANRIAMTEPEFY